MNLNSYFTLNSCYPVREIIQPVAITNRVDVHGGEAAWQSQFTTRVRCASLYTVT